MEVGGYVLHLYCDVEDCPSWHNGTNQEYGGPNRNHARRKAREEGWSLGKRTLCPQCNPRHKEGDA
jgi:hypothetical protein